MGTRTYYTIRQARLFLGGGEGKMVDGKILRKWLEEAGIDPQQNPRDKREWRITRTQLEELARKHKITLPDDEMLREDFGHALSLSALTQEIKALRQEIKEMKERLAFMQRSIVEDWANHFEQDVVDLESILRAQIQKAQAEARSFLHEQLVTLREELQHSVQKNEKS